MAARKMMLVPADYIDTLERKDPLTTPPSTNLKVELDREMEAVLNSKLPDYTKAQLFNNILQKFLAIYHPTPQHMSENLPKEEPQNASDNQIDISSPKTGELSEKTESVINQLTTKQYRGKALKIIQTLEHAGDNIIRWADKGNTVFIHNRLVPGGNLIDWIQFLLKSRVTSEPPAAFNNFQTMLASLPVPTSSIPNSKARKSIENSRKLVALTDSPEAAQLNDDDASDIEDHATPVQEWETPLNLSQNIPREKTPMQRRKPGVKVGTWKHFK